MRILIGLLIVIALFEVSVIVVISSIRIPDCQLLEYHAKLSGLNDIYVCGGKHD